MDALILAGGVAKGAFTAGALAVLLDPAQNPAPPRVRRIVAASSGALNGAYLAAAVHRGTEAQAGRELAALWLEQASALRTFDPSLAGAVGLAGFSTGRRLRELVGRSLHPGPGCAPIDLHLVVTSTRGEVRPCEAPPATTFEHVVPFDERTFATAEGIDELARAVVASCAFPGVFLPSPVRIRGAEVPCFDGGITNNAPAKYAIADPDVARVFVITPFPRVVPPSMDDLRGPGLLAHLADMLVNERLYRDLREARAVNRALEQLEREFPALATRERALRALGWEGRRRIEIVEIRPDAPLEKNAFEGLFSRELRARYVRAGEDAARAALRDDAAA